MFSRKSKEPAVPASAVSAAKGGAEQKAAASPTAPPSSNARPTSAQTSASAAAPAPEELQRQAAVAIRQSLAFAQIVSVLMRSPHYKHYSLTDLEWLVLPPLLTGQFSVAEAGPKEGGLRFPVAVALWASVSPEVDKRLSENLTAPIRLRPDEWKSGDILWLVDAVGDARVVGPLLNQLNGSAWQHRKIKARIVGEDGKPRIQSLSFPPDDKSASPSN